ncbi:MAG: DUF1499 domain-containing protein [Alphaproteobacteria bacterium]|nr:DUF1499 domain-containing protein [Alphaproteobacteria bacterium]
MRVMPLVFGIGIAALVVIVVMGVTPLGAKPFSALFEIGAVEKIDFSKASSIRGPAQWLVCPGYDMCAALDDRTPVYDNSVDSIKRTWDRLLQEHFPKMQLLLADTAIHQYTYVERSGFFQLPDLVTVQIFANGETRGSVAIFSRSVYKAGDFGSNSRRVIRMMDYLDEHLSLYKR